MAQSAHSITWQTWAQKWGDWTTWFRKVEVPLEPLQRGFNSSDSKGRKARAKRSNRT